MRYRYLALAELVTPLVLTLAGVEKEQGKQADISAQSAPKLGRKPKPGQNVQVSARGGRGRE